MEIRRINIIGHSEIETLKIYILQKLKLIDYKKDNLEEFETKIKSYLEKNQNQKLEFILDNERFEKDLKFDLKVANIETVPYPKNYEMGNPLNRWMFDGTTITEAESEKKDLNYENLIKNSIGKFNIFFSSLENLGKGQIKVVRK